MDEVPSARAVLERPGSDDGCEATVFLVKNPDADFPRELHPDIWDHFARNLPEGGEISDDVPQKHKREGAFAKIVLVGLSLSEALQWVRRTKAWYFERVVPEPLKRAERKRRRRRRQQLRAARRCVRHSARLECHQHRRNFHYGLSQVRA